MIINKVAFAVLCVVLNSIFMIAQAADAKSLSEYTDDLLKDKKVDESADANSLKKYLNRRKVS